MKQDRRTPTTRDTLAYAKRLREAGVPEAQANAQAEALDAFLGSDVASKADFELVRGDLRQVKTELDGRITLLQWMLGFNLALTTAVLGKLLFGH